jgi:hypothetical protein
LHSEPSYIHHVYSLVFLPTFDEHNIWSQSLGDHD